MKILTIRKYKKIITSVCLLLLILVLWIFYAPYGAKKHLAIEQESNLISTEITRLQEDNIKLQQEIAKIKDDPKHLEEVARKQYGLLKENEIVFDFSNKKSKKK